MPKAGKNVTDAKRGKTCNRSMPTAGKYVAGPSTGKHALVQYKTAKYAAGAMHGKTHTLLRHLCFLWLVYKTAYLHSFALTGQSRCTRCFGLLQFLAITKQNQTHLFYQVEWSRKIWPACIKIFATCLFPRPLTSLAGCMRRDARTCRKKKTVTHHTVTMPPGC